MDETCWVSCLRENLTSSSYGEGLETGEEPQHRANPLHDNEAGASFDFSIAPKFYQTTWFWSLVVASFLASLVVLYQLRLRYLKHQFNVRLEPRVGERTRIARDLHDTLLQSFQAVILKLSTVKY